MKKLPQQRLIIVACAVLLLTVLWQVSASYNRLPFALWTQHMTSQTPVNITVAPLGTINKPIQIARMGSIESSASVPVRAELSGHLSTLYVAEGQAVKAGQPLLTLEASSEATVNQTVEVPPQTQANYDNAREEFQRYQKLFEVGAIARRQLEMAATRLQDAKESLTKAQNTTQTSNSTINHSTTINAPISGIVTGLSTTVGATVQSGQKLMSLGSGQEVEIVVPIDQNDLYLVHLGTPATIEVSQQTLAGQVSRIYPQVEANQIVSFLAHIQLTTNPAGLLTSGMSVPVRIDTGNSAIVPAVPSASVFQDNQGGHFIYLATSGKAILQPISIGETSGDFTEITVHLPQQSMIIISNLNDIKDGDAITVIPQTED